ncbi:hypothetical protein PAMP_021883 [Pampus punctatissimus]
MKLYTNYDDPPVTLPVDDVSFAQSWKFNRQAEKQRKAKVRNMKSDGSCLLVAGGRGGGGIDGLISGSDYLLITIRREPLEEEENVSETTACLPLKNDERKEVDADTRVDTTERNGCIKGKGHKHHSHRRVRSPSFDEELSPRPKGKKKKRKSERKRKRRSSSSLKHKRKDERKHKKSSRTHSRRRRRYRRSESDSSSCQSSTEDRHHLQKSVVHQALGDLADVREETNGVLDRTDMKWRPATKSVCKTAPKYRSILSTGTILSSKPGSELLQGKGSHHLSSQTDAPHDYDSGNDTSSPPSSKTGVSRASVTVSKQDHCQRLASPEKLKFTDRDNASDSGNSVTSYASLCKPYGEDGLSAALLSGNDKRALKRLYVFALQRADEFGVSGGSCEISEDIWLFAEEEKVFSKAAENAFIQQEEQEQIVGEFQILGTLLSKPVTVILQVSLLEAGSYSRSPSYSADLRRRGSVASVSSRGSYSRYSADRLRDRKRTPRSRETDVKHKVSGKRRRRKSYSPMKKRRRDSPSHLEARRITSVKGIFRAFSLKQLPAVTENGSMTKCQEETHPILPTQSFLQQPIHQRFILEQPLHTQPQSQPDPQYQPEPEQEPQPQLLLLQELQSEFILELNLWEPQSQSELWFAEQT